MFRQDYRINKIFFPFHLPAMGLGQARRAWKKGKSIIPLRGKTFTHCSNKTVMQRNKHSLLIPRPFFLLKRKRVFSASSGVFTRRTPQPVKKNQVNPCLPAYGGLILSENILALCLNNY